MKLTLAATTIKLIKPELWNKHCRNHVLHNQRSHFWDVWMGLHLSNLQSPHLPSRGRVYKRTCNPIKTKCWLAICCCWCCDSKTGLFSYTHHGEYSVAIRPFTNFIYQFHHKTCCYIC
jgi:hypothetical protein